MDYITLGSTPSDEACAQVGSPHYVRLAKLECGAWARQLRRKFPIPESIGEDVFFTTRYFSHDFGGYREIALCYNSTNEEAIEYVLKVDNETPTEWDSEARAELGDEYFQTVNHKEQR